MRRVIVLLLITGSAVAALTPTDCLINMAPKWEPLATRSPHEHLGMKSIVIGSITFRKKCKQPAKLDTITLSWHGKRINQLSGSLYKKIPEKRFVPIDTNLVADGSWNSAQQKLRFHFNDNKQTLGPINIFYVVLTVPQNLEKRLRTGSFSLSHHNLPDMFALKQDELKLNLAQL